MKKRYTVKRGRRKNSEFDVLVYEGKKLRFVGMCYPAGERRLCDSELRIIAAIKCAVEELL